MVAAAVEEDAHGVAISSYQGGHVEYFTYLVDRLREEGCGHVKMYGGGGGVIVPSEIDALDAYGVTRIFSPQDGQRLGLDGMIDGMVAARRATRPRSNATSRGRSTGATRLSRAPSRASRRACSVEPSAAT